MEEVDGFTNVKTDGTTCTFDVTDKSVDVKGKLAEVAKSNDHMAGYDAELDIKAK